MMEKASADGACNDGTLATQSEMNGGGAGSMPNGKKRKETKDEPANNAPGRKKVSKCK